LVSAVVLLVRNGSVHVCCNSLNTFVHSSFSPPQTPPAAKPSDLLAELQGRLPIRVTLKGLTEEDMYRILTEPVSNLIRQQVRSVVCVCML
jgi:hypothetical protein